MFPLRDPYVIGRKEILFFFGLFVNLFLIERSWKSVNIKQIFARDKLIKNVIDKYCFNLLIWYNLLSIPAALSHESIIFLSLPINIIITFSFLGLKLSVKQVIVRTALIYTPTIIVTSLCLIFRGDILDAVVICQSWQEYVGFAE
jgi:hypothetical protein